MRRVVASSDSRSGKSSSSGLACLLEDFGAVVFLFREDFDAEVFFLDEDFEEAVFLGTDWLLRRVVGY